MTTVYAPGDRVWVWNSKTDEWWPGRILSDEELQALNISRAAHCDLAIFMYSEVEQEASEVLHRHSVTHASELCYFESSSEKAVTPNVLLRSAIRNAMNDPTATPMRVEAVAATTTPSAPLHPPQRFKRKRETTTTTGESPSHQYIRKPASELRRLAEEIQAAKEVLPLRKLLAKLDNVDVFPHELEDTKIGVAVGDILGNISFQALWPLARAIISFWSRHLPKETLATIQIIKSSVPGVSSSIMLPPTVLPAPGGIPLWAAASPTGGPTPMTQGFPSFPGSPRVEFPGSPFTALPSALPGGRKTGGDSSRTSFYSHVYTALDNPSATQRYSTEVLNKVTKDLVSSITTSEDRQQLLQRLRNPDLVEIRNHLLSGSWTAADYLRQPEEAFLTESEKMAKRRRVEEVLEAEEQAKRATMNETSLFTCENCGKKRCTYYEQQTRGGDEPSTKFISCLECKTTWTQE